MSFPWTLFQEAVATGCEYVPCLRGGVARAGHLFQEGREGEAVSRFNQLLDGLEWLGSLVDSTEFVVRQGLIELAESGRVLRAAAAFRAALRELLEAWENADYVLIGDLLVYELVPVLEEWGIIIGAMEERFSQESPSM